MLSGFLFFQKNIILNGFFQYDSEKSESRNLNTCTVYCVWSCQGMTGFQLIGDHFDRATEQWRSTSSLWRHVIWPAGPAILQRGSSGTISAMVMGEQWQC